MFEQYAQVFLEVFVFKFRIPTQDLSILIYTDSIFHQFCFEILY